MNIVESSRVLQQVRNKNRVRLGPRIIERDLRYEITDAVVQIQLTALDKLQHSQGGKHLRNGTDPEQRFRRRIDVLRAVRLTKGRCPDNLVL